MNRAISDVKNGLSSVKRGTGNGRRTAAFGMAAREMRLIKSACCDEQVNAYCSLEF